MKVLVVCFAVCLIGVMATEEKITRRFKRHWLYITCPEQTDFSAPFRLSSDSTNYPESAINNELKNRGDGIDTCLARQNVPPTASKVPDDPVLGNFTRDTCPVVKQTLRSYFNTLINSTCWIILNVQEMINFASCKNVKCQYCRWAGYYLQNRCFLQFDVFSVWSFCEELPALSQIFRDRIIVPTTCVCKQVQCRRKYRHFW